MNDYTDLDVNINNIMKSEQGISVWPCPICKALNERPTCRGIRAEFFAVGPVELPALICGSNIECCICGMEYRCPIDFGDD